VKQALKQPVAKLKPHIFFGVSHLKTIKTEKRLFPNTIWWPVTIEFAFWSKILLMKIWAIFLKSNILA